MPTLGYLVVTNPGPETEQEWHGMTGAMGSEHYDYEPDIPVGSRVYAVAAERGGGLRFGKPVDHRADDCYDFGFREAILVLRNPGPDTAIVAATTGPDGRSFAHPRDAWEAADQVAGQKDHVALLVLWDDPVQLSVHDEAFGPGHHDYDAYYLDDQDRAELAAAAGAA
jgi:hypothetical protein